MSTLGLAVANGSTLGLGAATGGAATGSTTGAAATGSAAADAAASCRYVDVPAARAWFLEGPAGTSFNRRASI